MDGKDNMSLDTKIVHGHKKEFDPHSLSHRIPIYQTSTFTFPDAREGEKILKGEVFGYTYTRLDNPIIRYLEEKLAFLEGGEDGLVFASGMGAISTVFHHFLKPEDSFVVTEPLYGGTYELIFRLKESLGVRVYRILAENHLEKLEKILRETTPKFIFVETPANPDLSVFDLEGISKLAKGKEIPVVVDNTFATFYHQTPLSWGCDLVVYSLTKYINGHDDVIGGAVIGKRDLINKLRECRARLGACISPHDAYLVLRGLKTLHIRMQRHSENAMKIAEFLEGHPVVEKVFYPGLKSHPQHEIARKQMKNGFSGMVSFLLRGGIDECRAVLNSVKVWTLAVSLGDTDSLIEHPATMTHWRYLFYNDPEVKIPDNLIRLSCGLEDPEDLINDLDSAFNKLIK